MTGSAPVVSSASSSLEIENVKKEVIVSPALSGSTSNVESVSAKKLDVSTATAKIEQICKAISSGSYESAKSLFTDEGYTMFLSLARDGKAKVLNNSEEYEFIETYNGYSFRSVPMKLTYGSKITLEDVNFSFDSNHLISSLSFALSDMAKNSIMSNDWDDNTEYMLLNFKDCRFCDNP